MPALGSALAPPGGARIESVLLLAWLAVSLALAARFAIGQVRAHRVAARARPAGPGDLPIDTDALRRRIGVRRRVRILLGSEVASPLAGGLVEPYVLLPRDLVPGLTAEQLEWVLLHELAHIRRGDLYAGYCIPLCHFPKAAVA